MHKQFLNLNLGLAYKSKLIRGEMTEVFYMLRHADFNVRWELQQNVKMCFYCRDFGPLVRCVLWLEAFSIKI